MFDEIINVSVEINVNSNDEIIVNSNEINNNSIDDFIIISIAEIGVISPLNLN